MSHCDYEITGKNAAKVFQALGPAAELFCYVCNSVDGGKTKIKPNEIMRHFQIKVQCLWVFLDFDVL